MEQGKRWVVANNHNPDTVDALSQQLNINPILAKLLVLRGVETYLDSKTFFRPQWAHLHNPFTMAGMEVAVNRIVKAIETKEKILVFGDYDVDGTTAVALVYSFIKEFYPNLDYYIPDRYTEGYGISTQGIDFAHQNGFGLIIALDCGIKSVDKIAYANTLGVDFIICDHHLPGDELPAAVAILDPKQSHCPYPYKELSGCGIGYKLLQALAERMDIDEAKLRKYIDLVVVSIASDLVPITGENRTLAYFGLEKLNTKPLAGLKALLDIGKVKTGLTISDVVFTIGPRINAAGRIEKGSSAVKLLITGDATLANDVGNSINEHNTIRRELDKNITAHALDMVASLPDVDTRNSTVVYHPEWHKGVIGIVASRLIENYYRPTIVLTQTNGHVAGSARSVNGFDLYEAIEACSHLLIQFGGHKHAAGLTMETDNVPAFVDAFEAYVRKTIDPKMLTPQVEIDTEIALTDITEKFFKVLTQFAPFGPGNMNPVFVTHNVYLSAPPRVVGQKHLKLLVVPEAGKPQFECIAFNQADMIQQFERDKPFSICYSIEANTWKDKTTLQLNIKDIRVDKKKRHTAIKPF